MRSAIWIATLKKYHTIGDLLIRSGIDVNKPIGPSTHLDHRTTLLHVAARSGKLHRVKLLLDHGADPNAKDSRGKTVLHYAVAWDQAEVADHLISAGADIHTKDKYGLNALHYAILKRAESAVRILLQRKADIDAVDSRGWNALHMAMLMRCPKLTYILLKNNIKVNVPDTMLWTPLHFAVKSGKEQIIRQLLNYGANVNLKTRDGCFPLYYAVTCGSLNIVKLLLDKGARVNEYTADGETALHAACQHGFGKIADTLLNYDANVNLRNNSGKVALSMVTREKNYDTSKVIAKHIARLDMKNTFVNRENRRDVMSDPDLYNFYEKCYNQLSEMKLMKIEEGSNISYYYILSEDLDKVSSAVRNQQLTRSFEMTNLNNKFAIYADDLRCKFDAAKMRSHFLSWVENLLRLKLDPHLPEIAVQKIARYLKEKDIKMYTIV